MPWVVGVAVDVLEWEVKVLLCVQVFVENAVERVGDQRVGVERVFCLLFDDMLQHDLRLRWWCGLFSLVLSHVVEYAAGYRTLRWWCRHWW